ncbi:MAG: RagB/SusD family nutrient uptake outer membrane protein, partial [Proteiniphilum sp.]|nr:RagB/SusD family nutrient uptake outer membrane protein [Proteiniphilum sp.]
MKNKILIIAALVSLLLWTGCEDFLTQTNNTNPNQETFFDSDQAVEAATSPLYNYVWYTFNEKFYYGMGDGRANNITARWSDYIYPYTNLTETALSIG